MLSRKLYIVIGVFVCLLFFYLIASNYARDPTPISPEVVRQALHQLPNSTLTFEAPYVNAIDHGYQFRFSTTSTIEDIQRYYDPILRQIGFSSMVAGDGMIDENGRDIQLRWWATAGEWHSIRMSLDNGTLYSYYVHGYFR